MASDSIVRCACGQKMRVRQTEQARRVFCPQCGSSLLVPVAVPSATKPSPVSSLPSPPDSSPAGRGWWVRWGLFAGGVAILMAILVGMLALVTRSHDAKQVAQVATEAHAARLEPEPPGPPPSKGARGEGRGRGGDRSGTGSCYALLVGVKEYEHPKLRPLAFTENDAVKVGVELQKAGYEVIILCDSRGKQDAGYRPTKANIDRHLAALLAKCRKQDVILVAFAGHGLQFEGENDSYFCPADAKPYKEQSGTLVSLQGVYRQLDQSNAGAKLLLVDACRNDPSRSRGARSFNPEDVRPPSGVVALFSCKAGEEAFEHERYQHGVFFYHVLEGLKGAAAQEGEVTYNTLVAYVVRRVQRDVPQLFGSGVKQTPHQRGDLEGDIVLVMNAAWAKSESPPRSPLPDRPAAPPPKTRPTLAKAPFPADQARRHQQEWGDYLGQPLEFENTIGMKLRLIPPGEFLMGSPASEQDRSDDELQHQVRLTTAYYLGTFEVTQAQYEQVMGTNPSRFQGSALPVERVSWEDAQEFLRKLNDRERSTGRVYRLPSEAEWEYACRAGTTTPFHHGESLDASQANFNGNSPYGKGTKGEYRERTTLVGSFRANALGLYDLHGNVLEWCQDGYDKDFYRSSPTDNPVNEHVNTGRALRGGSWFTDGRFCRAADRNWFAPGVRVIFVGFRVVCSAAPRTP
jgi:formylglycine-generating enzyme required for sulfatase activity